MAFYLAQLRSIPDLWIKVHSDLSLPPPDPIWPQTASRLMFEDMLIEMLKGKHLQERAGTPEKQVHMGTDQENVLRYVKGFVPSSYYKSADRRTQKRPLPL